MQKFTITIIVILAVSLAAILAMQYCKAPTSVQISYVPPESSPGLHVLFLGNSYTFFNNLPRMIAGIAASDTINPVKIQPGIFSMDGATLESLWKANLAQNMIRSRHWDYVVLQEQSLTPVVAGLIPAMQDAMTRWSRLIQTSGATPIVFETWARKGGSDWYDSTKYPGLDLGDPDKMQARIDGTTNGIAEQLRLRVIPVGDYWATCSKLKGLPDLYYEDGSHPSIAGDYLTALLFYRYLTGHNLEHITYVPAGVSKEKAQLLIRCAS
jgi:hypothetical protein